MPLATAQFFFLGVLSIMACFSFWRPCKQVRAATSSLRYTRVNYCCCCLSSGDFICCLFLLWHAVLCKNRPGNYLQTVVSTSYKCYSTALMSVSSEYNTYMRRTRQGRERVFPASLLLSLFSLSLQLCPSFSTCKVKSQNHTKVVTSS